MKKITLTVNHRDVEEAKEVAEAKKPPIHWPDVQQAESDLLDALRNRKKLSKNTPRIGLAISGGGIRSATFALGILQSLKTNGLLKYVQYLSTVSGGGYIGAWLVSAYRNQLGEAALERGKEPIHHLRQYSRYLTPKEGALSSDTWTLASIWLRNTSLIQIAILLAAAMLLLLPRFAAGLFDLAEKITIWGQNWLLPGLVSTFVLTIAIVFTCECELAKIRRNIANSSLGQSAVVWRAAIPIVVASGFSAMSLWTMILGQRTLAHKLMLADSFIEALRSVTAPEWILHWSPGIVLALLALIIGFNADGRRPQIVILAALVVGIVGGLGFIALAWLGEMLDLVWKIAPGPWWPLIGPSMILIVFCMVVVLFLGILGADLADYEREWWSRLGAWLFLLACSGLVVVLIALPAPFWLKWLWNSGYKALQSVGAAAVIGWIASTATSVLAGKSSETSGDKTQKNNRILELVTMMGPYVFILGFLIVIASALQAAVWQLARAIAGYPVTPGFYPQLSAAGILFGSLGLLGAAAWTRFDLNEFSMNHFYRNRLVRAYMGATNRHPDPNHFIGFDFKDDYPLSSLVTPPTSSNPSWTWADPNYDGPFVIVNTAINMAQGGDLDLQDRKAENFVFTPAYSGDSCYRENSVDGYYRPTGKYLDPENKGIRYGTAIAISGAAASPNMGYHTSSAVAFLLTMFNVRLGWWVANPQRETWQQLAPTSHFTYLMYELFGSSKRTDKFVYLSDGGHFENLAIYELVRRRCEIIICCDGEADPCYFLEGLAGLIRKCNIDFHVDVDIDVSAIRNKNDKEFNGSHYAMGTIRYEDGTKGTLIYLKASMTGDEPEDIVQYKNTHSDFPHETTTNQWFSEDQFESYRHLGWHVGKEVLAKAWQRSGQDWGRMCDILEQHTTWSADPESLTAEDPDLVV